MINRSESLLCSLVVVVGCTFAVGACKGSTTVKDNPATLEALENCKKNNEQKQKLITDYEGELAKLNRNGASGGEIVLSIENSVLTVKPGASGAGPRPIDDKTAAAASQQFIDLVSRSRGAIQKCYEQALKKDSGLQARTVTLKVSANFSQAGALQGSRFSPSLGDAFDSCMRAVASKWQMPAGPQAMSFQAPVSLTPS